MSAIESDAQPTLAAMIAGKPMILERRTQEVLASWLGVKAIIQCYTQSPIQQTEPEWINYYHEHHSPPTTWRIYIAPYIGGFPVYFAGAELEMMVHHTLSPFAVPSFGRVFSIAIGYFFGQVLMIDRQFVVPRNPRPFSQVWPHPLLRPESFGILNPELILWPPETGWLDDADLENYAPGFAQFSEEAHGRPT